MLVRRLLITIVVVLILCIPIFSLAHSGGTDSQGGHRDTKNVSGLGEYHYHHGYGPHLHPNGVCPYVDTTPTYNEPYASSNFVGSQSTQGNSNSNDSILYLLGGAVAGAIGISIVRKK